VNLDLVGSASVIKLPADGSARVNSATTAARKTIAIPAARNRQRRHDAGGHGDHPEHRPL
jgi:hypothetical protein